MLDLGTGSGLVAIAAATAGAAQVSAVDVDPYACIAADLNAGANDVLIAVTSADLLDSEAPEVEMVLAGDLFYDTGLAERAAAFLGKCVRAGLIVLIGDPFRPSLPADRMRLLESYSVAQTEGGPGGPSGVFTFLG